MNIEVNIIIWLAVCVLISIMSVFINNYIAYKKTIYGIVYITDDEEDPSTKLMHLVLNNTDVNIKNKKRLVCKLDYTSRR